AVENAILSHGLLIPLHLDQGIHVEEQNPLEVLGVQIARPLRRQRSRETLGKGLGRNLVRGGPGVDRVGQRLERVAGSRRPAEELADAIALALELLPPIERSPGEQDEPNRTTLELTQLTQHGDQE